MELLGLVLLDRRLICMEAVILYKVTQLRRQWLLRSVQVRRNHIGGLVFASTRLMI
jgi:hypothetical protein